MPRSLTGNAIGFMVFSYTDFRIRNSVFKGEVNVLQRNRLSDEVFEILRAEIVGGQLRGGQELTDTEVANRFQISRTPAREALLRLAERKLLLKDVRKHQGYIVVQPSVQDIAEVYSLRSVLERLAVEILRLRPDRQQVASDLEHILSQKRSNDADEASRVNDLFHRSVVRHSQHAELIQQHQMLQDRMAIFRHTSLRNAEHVAIADREHHQLVALLGCGDPAVGLFAQRHVCAAGFRLIAGGESASDLSSLYHWLKEQSGLLVEEKGDLS